MTTAKEKEQAELSFTSNLKQMKQHYHIARNALQIDCVSKKRTDKVPK